MSDPIEIRMVAVGVDWTALKKDLAHEGFDNGRTPEQLETYSSLGFEEDRFGMSRVVGDWLTPG